MTHCGDHPGHCHPWRRNRAGPAAWRQAVRAWPSPNVGDASALARLDASTGSPAVVLACRACPAINKGVTVQRSAFGRRVAAACVVTGVLVTGCSSSSTSTSSSSASVSNSAVCSDIANLKASIQGLANVSITQNGLSAISDQITKIRQQLQTFMSHAQGQYTTQVNDLTNALNGLSSSFDAAKASPSVSTLTALASSAKTVVTAGQNLVTAVSSTC
jgi:hypothetical protein